MQISFAWKFFFLLFLLHWIQCHFGMRKQLDSFVCCCFFFSSLAMLYYLHYNKCRCCCCCCFYCRWYSCVLHEWINYGFIWCCCIDNCYLLLLECFKVALAFSNRSVNFTKQTQQITDIFRQIITKKQFSVWQSCEWKNNQNDSLNTYSNLPVRICSTRKPQTESAEI